MMNLKTWSDYSKYFNNNTLSLGFTNKHYPFSKPIDRIEFAKDLGLVNQGIVKPIQVHSNIVRVVNHPGDYDNTDGVLTGNKKLILSIQVADCIPIFVYDKKINMIGLIHAGWRGIADSIVFNISKQLIENDVNLQDVQVLLGPSIRKCCFEIGPEVAKIFDRQYLTNGAGYRSYLDLQGYVINEFNEIGIKRNQITDIDECTCCSDNYYSYRRDGDKAGRMIAMIGFKEDNRK